MDVFYFLVTITGASTIIIWLGKFIITKTVDAGIEKYKAELVKDIEKHKADLSRITIEHQVKFSKLHEERGEKIKLLYEKVIALEQALIYSTTFAQGPDYVSDSKREDECINKIVDLSNTVNIEKIFFSNDTIAKFQNIVDESWQITRTMKRARDAASTREHLISVGKQVPKEYLDRMDKWDEANSRTEKEFFQLKEELANEFRKLLGIDF